MKTRTSELTVGFFVVFAVAALCFLAIRVSGIGDELSKKGYTLQAHFENIGGLTERAKVTISGVTIGHVTKITLDNKRLDALVEMQIDDNMKQIDTGATASILTSGLLGEKYIGISVGGDADMLKNGGVIEQTQSALVLEDLIGKFLFNKSQEAPKTSTP